MSKLLTGLLAAILIVGVWLLVTTASATPMEVPETETETETETELVVEI